MRWNLLKTYDKIYTIDLHGNSKKKEVSPDGSVDVNVFDIMQGVSINLFIKTGNKKQDELGKVFHFDLYGEREFKYDFLSRNTLSTIPYTEISNKGPMFFMVQKDYHVEDIYNKGFSVSEIFNLSNVGIVTSKDAVLINGDKKILTNNVRDFYQITPNVDLIKRISYRPFDEQFVYYDPKIIERAREKVVQPFLKGENIGLIIGRQGQVVGAMPWNLALISKSITDFNLYYRGGGMVFPLHLYPEQTSQTSISLNRRIHNLDPKIVSRLATILSLTFTNEKETTEGTFAPIDTLDYIYAILHSPTYRETYKEFLRIDFPRVPYPTDTAEFWRLVKLGGALRQIHLLESPETEKYITQYPIDGSNEVIKPKYDSGKVFINDMQYFDNVPKLPGTSTSVVISLLKSG